MSVNSSDLFKYGLTSEGMSKAVYEICVRCNSGQIDNAINVNPDVLLGAKRFDIVLILPDDSGSISQYEDSNRNHTGPEAICQGQKGLIASFQAAVQQYRDGMVVLTWPLNADLPLQPFTLIDSNPELLQDGSNYHAEGGTPLYDKTALLLVSALAFRLLVMKESSAECEGSILIISDGEDQHSKMFSTNDVSVLVNELAKAKITTAFMGIEGNTAVKVDFRDIAHQMGITDDHIMVTSADPHDIRQAFKRFGDTTMNAMQNR